MYDQFSIIDVLGFTCIRTIWNFEIWSIDKLHFQGKIYMSKATRIAESTFIYGSMAAIIVIGAVSTGTMLYVLTL